MSHQKHESNVTTAQMFTASLPIKPSCVEGKFPPWWSIKTQPNRFYYSVFFKPLDLSKKFQQALWTYLNISDHNDAL